MENDFRAAFERIERWMRENGAELLADNLAPGAEAEDLDACEERIGFALGPELRALWSVHDGQHEEQNGFYLSYDLFSSAQADAEDVMLSLSFMRDPAGGSRKSEMTADELASDAWLQIAGRDSDGVAVNLESGRVFRHEHDNDPALRCIAPSLLAWLEGFSLQVAAGDYRVDEGFGDVYLTERDRQAEAREAAWEKEEERRSELPPLDLLTLSLALKDDDVALQAYERTTAGTERTAFLEVLFDKASPTFVVAALRLKANELVLTKSQWKVFAKGAKKLENNALVALAERKLAAL